MDCPAAMERIKEGRPITIKSDDGNTSECIAQVVSVSIKYYHKLVFTSHSPKPYSQNRLLE